ncbi:dephospho-CoA kinase [Granulosicoccus antarcticus]|uniref:Dephospho-CoA kinase n=1 Tax=Granulosicoccus antarcticus IMCC3135 TaxID=1192854 RepID=A0A2Z2NZL6_9GAMM|nr:dephospho-CoA kinase [Granulosicoccus antarcticus]ASJ75875.1 Dephospho-CoA kinase [Granulosicoccus antarcticus IMCC3135]
MLLVGLTGGIASGKTLVTDYFKSLGAWIIDADVLAREVVEPGSPGLNALVAHFSPDILNADGTLNRTALRHIVFATPSEREFLDQTLHPLIRQLSGERIAAARQIGHPYTIYAVPLLVETGQQERFDRIVVIDVPKALQLQRLLVRDDSTEVEANAILASQASREQRLAIANDIIDNAGSKADTRLQVTALHDQYSQYQTTT